MEKEKKKSWRSPKEATGHGLEKNHLELEHRDIVHTDFDRDNEFADDIQVAIHIDEVSLCKE